MSQRAFFPSKYIQGANIINELPDIIKDFGSKPVIIASPSVKSKILPSYGEIILKKKIDIIVFNGECTNTEIDRCLKIINDNHYDIVIAMGGGKTIDTGKICADKANLPVIVIPTIASTDAPCSACAVTYTKEGNFESVLYQKTNPTMVIVDTKVIANAPARFLISGMGDALATFFEAKSCLRSNAKNECNGHSTLTAFQISKLCYDTLLRYGLLAKIANENQIVTPALNNIIEANILLSGIGFESCGLATAHAVHNGLTELPETHKYYHGEKVAFGVLTGLHLNSEDKQTIDTVYEFCKQIGLPTTFSEIGLKNISKDKLLKIATKTCSKEQSIHHEITIITKEKVIDALIMANAYGEKF
ncbi:MAG: glycerol dehydrogenase [Candidatus Cloacimonetes bacterium]|nr:glycerol dehydrogenase [Candidatus Cloacimonadota bacterium]